MLSSLLSGQSIKLGDYTYRLFKEGEEVEIPGDDYVYEIPEGHYWLGVEVYPYGSTVCVGHVGVMDLDLCQFIKMCDKLTDYDIIIMEANAALQRCKPPRPR